MSDALKSRKFWAAIVGILVMVLAQFFPGFQIDQERGVALLVVIGSYVVGAAVDPGPGGWAGVFKSRKFWAASVGLFVVLLGGFGIKTPIPEDALVEIASFFGLYIAGVALEKPKGQVTPLGGGVIAGYIDEIRTHNPEAQG